VDSIILGDRIILDVYYVMHTNSFAHVYQEICYCLCRAKLTSTSILFVHYACLINLTVRKTQDFGVD
jgi:hypothetical protein